MQAHPQVSHIQLGRKLLVKLLNWELTVKGSNHLVTKIKGLKGKQSGNGLVPFTSQSDSRGHVLSPVKSLKGQTLNIEHFCVSV